MVIQLKCLEVRINNFINEYTFVLFYIIIIIINTITIQYFNIV